jgi:hypothetical protein
MNLRLIRLRDQWARRKLKIVVRVSSTGRLVLDYLRAAERGEQSAERSRGVEDAGRVRG